MLATHPHRRRTIGLSRALGLAIAVLLLSLTSSYSQESLPQSLIPPGDSKPIQLYADDVATWMDGKQRVFLLVGKVTFEQGALNLRMPRAVVWIDEERRQTHGTYFLNVYGEGGVLLDNGVKSTTGSDALLTMTTRGDIRINAYARKVVEKNMAAEPVFERAVKLKNQPPPVEPAIKQVQGIMPPPGPAPGVQQRPTPPAKFPQGQPPALQPDSRTPLVKAPGDGEPRKFTVRPRSSQGITATNYAINGETVVVVPTPIILTVINPVDGKVIADIEADRLAFWTKGNPNEVFGNLRSNQGQTSRQLEFYLSGNVEIRNTSGKETEILRADEVYYDVGRSVAIALRGDLEVRDPKIPYPLHFQADELLQLNAKMFQGKAARIYSTALPSDPSLKIEVREFTLNEEEIVRKTIFGQPYIDRKTGEPQSYKLREFTGWNNVLRLEGVPILWLPKLRGDIMDPLGPLDNISVNYNRVFGLQLFTTWDVHDLLGMAPAPGTRWRLFLDGMTARGPALGTEYDFAGTDLFGFSNRYQGLIKAYGIYDTGTDILGGDRGTLIYVTPTTTVPTDHPDWRGRFLSKINVQDMPAGFSIQAQLSAISDRTFLEQFFHREWYNDLNQETFVYLKQQNDFWAWTVLAEPNIRRWITETEWLPKADAHILGFSLFDIFTYNMRASAGYAQLRPTEEPQFAYSPTDVRINTGRFDLWNELSMPFAAGPFKFVPYVIGDGSFYTRDLTGDDRARAYVGGGIRASIPFSRLYYEAQSDILNVDGLFHKISLTGNYFAAHSDTPMNQLPQLDRLNDDASDQALRDLFLRQITLNPANGAFLTTSPIFDPQIYALRRLIDTKVDTLDSMEVVQLGIRQRLQTKRGMPGNEHVIDWMTLDLNASIFPHSQRDNFGERFGVLEYDWIWNIGDRTAFTSNGWFETLSGGPRVFNVGVLLNRPDRTNFYIGYRQIDPLESRAVVASLTYAFSAKYAITASTFYDFGVNSQANSLVFSRIGTDLQVNLGITYNSILNTFGVTFEVLPNLLPGARNPGAGHMGGALAGR